MRTACRCFAGLGVVVVAGLVFFLAAPEARAYVEAPHSLGQIINLSTNVVLMRVEAVDHVKNLIIYRKVRDLKGKHPQEVIKHNIGKAGFNEREWKIPMAWAEVGKLAVFFHNGGASETCTGMYWYQCYAGGEWWNQSHGEPFLLRSYAGRVEKLAAAVTAILDNKEVIVSCMVDGNKDDLHLQRARLQRCRASLKLNNYDQKRDFAGWGGEDFRRLNGLPGFTHYSALARVDPDAQSISCLDIDGDGKLDLCLAGAGKIALLQNGGEAMTEVSIPGGNGGRAAVWADYNGDGLPDLLLATMQGPKLYTNLGKGVFRDDTRLLPKEPAYNLTCAAWIDQNGDGKPDILLGNGFFGLRLYRNNGQGFADVSDEVGLGANGIGSTTKGDTLTVFDCDGDGRSDFLYGAGSGLLVRNTADGFKVIENSGLSYKTGRVGPVVADFFGRGSLDVLIPRSGTCQLFQNDGKGQFTDVSEKVGLTNFTGNFTCAAVGDVDNDGHLDLVLGCIGQANRFLRNKGDDTFEDASAAIGLNQRVFNTQAICLADLNNDGMLDMVFNNEGQESCVLLGNPEFAQAAKKTAVSLTIGGKVGVVGSTVRLLDMQGKLLASTQVSGGDGRGGQTPPLARFALAPGNYKVEVTSSTGAKRDKAIQVATTPMRGVVE